MMLLKLKWLYKERNNMKYKNYTKVYYSIENEGLGYFLTRYTSANTMPDEKGEELFNIAKQALLEFENYVNQQMEKEDIGDDYDD